MNFDYIIPAFNEEKNISRLVKEIRSFTNDRIIIVDDASSDRTYSVIPDMKNIIKIRNSSNMGKGYSIKSGVLHSSTDYFCIMDGDMKGAGACINRVKQELSQYDCIIFSPPIKNGGFGIVRKYASWIVFKETGIKVSWCLSGLRIIKRSVFDNIKPNLEDRFAFETSMTIELLRNGYRIANIPADFRHRVTVKNIPGFLHRGRQFGDILLYRLKKRT